MLCAVQVQVWCQASLLLSVVLPGLKLELGCSAAGGTVQWCIEIQVKLHETKV
jgi:hypothetical protein